MSKMMHKTNIASTFNASELLSKISGGRLFAAFSEYFIFPGFCDVHVHFRQPGFSYKETIKTGSAAAARGGYTTVCTMPKLDPVPDSLDNLKIQKDIIDKDSIIQTLPYGSITVKQQGAILSNMEDMYDSVIAFSDDGRGVQSEELMRNAMLKAKSLNKIIVAHCEDNSLLHGGYIHDGAYAAANGHKGICSESEYLQIKRDIELVKEIGCAYHVCHISTKESVELIRNAKKQGINITCETAPHYLTLDDSHLQEDGRFKMNPPLRSPEDRYALLEGIVDGTIDMIATDHAPHSFEEKNRGLSGSVFGVVGLETAFPIMYTRLVKEEKIISLEKLIKLMAINPRQRFGIEMGQDCTVWDLNKTYVIDPKSFLSMGKATPFQGHKVFGECIATVYDGEFVYVK